MTRYSISLHDLSYHDLSRHVRPCLHMTWHNNWLLTYYQDEGLHAMSYHLMRCHYHAMSCSYQGLLFHVMPCHSMSWHAIPCHAMRYHVRILIHDTITRLVAEYYQMKDWMPCRFPLGRAISCHAMLTCNAMSDPVMTLYNHCNIY